MNIFLTKEIKNRKGEVHFRRYRLLELPWFRIYIHQILKEDRDGDEHDHPWDFASLILRGGYVEQSNGNLRTKKVGNLSVCKRPTTHLLYKILAPTWTFIFSWGRRTEWGYNTPKGWVDHITYRKEKHCT
jgi:hypothetical protein